MISLMWNLRDKTKKEKRGEENRLLTIEDKLVVMGGDRSWGGEKGDGDQEYTCRDEHRVMRRLAESLYCAPKADTTLYGSST